jgi:hypothetical protein
MRWAWRQSYVHPFLSPNAQHALICIVDRWAPDTAVSWPTISDICARTHLSERAVRYATAELDFRGIVHKQARLNALGQKIGNEYVLSFDNDAEEEREDEAFADRKRTGISEAEYTAKYWSDLRQQAADDLFAVISDMSPERRHKFNRVIPELRMPSYMAAIDFTLGDDQFGALHAVA